MTDKDKIHLRYSKLARRALSDPDALRFHHLQGLPDPSSRKEVYGIGCLALVLCKNYGEKVSQEDLQNCFNKLKGKDTRARKEISHIFLDLSNSIPGTTLVGRRTKQELEKRSNKSMTRAIAETVLDTIVPSGSASIVETKNGWVQLFIASLLVLGIKLWGRHQS